MTDPTAKLKQSKEVKARLEEMAQKAADIQRHFITVFDNKNGKAVLEYLENYAHTNFPNYGVAEKTDGIAAVLATYSKIGEQTLVKHIKAVVKKGKGRGE